MGAAIGEVLLHHCIQHVKLVNWGYLFKALLEVELMQSNEPSLLQKILSMEAIPRIPTLYLWSWESLAPIRIFFCLEHMRLEGEMESLEHFLRQPDCEGKERGGGSGLEVTSALGIFYMKD